MSLSLTLRNAPVPTLKRDSFLARNWPMLVVALLLAVAAVFGTHAATTTGTVLQPAFDMLNEMVSGYGSRVDGLRFAGHATRELAEPGAGR